MESVSSEHSYVCVGIYTVSAILLMSIFSLGITMIRFLLSRNTVRQKDAISGVMSGLGALTVEIIYIVFMVLMGINLFRRGAYYELISRAGEGNKISRQAANVIGSLIYFMLAVILLPVVKVIAKRLFGG